MAMITMSRKELGRLEALLDLSESRITAARAARLIGVSARQVFRLLRAYRAWGAEGLVSRRRGRPSNRRYHDEIREAALATIRERYPDFGPTLAAEKLAETHGLKVSRETLRGWMIDTGLWLARQQRRRFRQPKAAPRGPERAGANRRQRAPLVRGPRGSLHAARLHRRGHRTIDAA